MKNKFRITALLGILALASTPVFAGNPAPNHTSLKEIRFAQVALEMDEMGSTLDKFAIQNGIEKTLTDRGATKDEKAPLIRVAATFKKNKSGRLHRVDFTVVSSVGRFDDSYELLATSTNGTLTDGMYNKIAEQLATQRNGGDGGKPRNAGPDAPKQPRN